MAWFIPNSQKANRQRVAIKEIQLLGGTTISMFDDGGLLKPYCSGQANLPWSSRNFRTRIFGTELSDDVYAIDLNSSGITESKIRDMIPWIKRLRTPKPPKAGFSGCITLNMWSNPNVTPKLLEELDAELPDVRTSLADPLAVDRANAAGGR